MNKRKLTKIVKKRRLNYKPTIGLTLENGKRISVNAVEYYIAIEKEKERKAKREVSKLVHEFIRKECPQLFALQEVLGGMGSWMYF